MKARIVLVLVLVLVLPSLAAASGHIIWVRTYDPAAGEFPEGIALDKQGNVYVSLPWIGQIRKISPEGAESLFHQLPADASPIGLAVDARGNLYAGVFTGGLNPAFQGVWRFDRAGAGVRLPGSESIFLPNGLAFDNRGNLYVTDSYVPDSMPPAGAIWRISHNGVAELWLQDSTLLGGMGQIPGYPPMGANGIVFRHNRLYVASTEKGLIAQVSVLPDGSPGDLSTVAGGPELWMIDGIALDVHGVIYAALVGQSQVVTVDPASGSVTQLAGPADGVEQPASLAFGTRRGEWQYLYFTNYAIGSQAHPGVLKMDVGMSELPICHQMCPDNDPRCVPCQAGW